MYENLSKIAVDALISCINTRRAEEVKKDKKGNKGISGFAEFTELRKEEKRIIKEAERAKKGYRKKKQPRVGDG